MDKLITVKAADDVTDEYKKEAKTWTKWDSKSRKAFNYNYNQEERVLVLEGSATLTPIVGADDEKVDDIVIEAGMSVIFHVGFNCKWKITKRMKKHYKVFPGENDAEDVEEEATITCDVCGKGCMPESYFVEDGELDICPKCFDKDKEKYSGAEHQKEGQKFVEKKTSKKKTTAKKETPKKKEAPKKKASLTKKAATKKKK